MLKPELIKNKKITKHYIGMYIIPYFYKKNKRLCNNAMPPVLPINFVISNLSGYTSLIVPLYVVFCNKKALNQSFFE